MARDRYKPRGYTWDVCPGCGKEPEQFYKRGVVCAVCRDLLQWAAIEQKKAVALQGVVLRYVPNEHYRLPHVFSPGASRAAHELLREMEPVFWQILQSLVLAYGGAGKILEDHSKTEMLPAGSEGTPWYSTPVMVPKPTADAIDRFHPLLEAIVRAVYEDGYVDGKNLIGQLAAGKATLEEIAEADATIAKGVQEAREINARTRPRRRRG